MHTRFVRTSLVAVVAADILISGCATNIPKAEMSKDVVSAYKIDADDQPTIKVTTAAGVNATEDEKEHFRNLVTDKLNARRAHNAANNDSKKCEVDITVTKFEKGSKFARAMLAGLGQIHLDANVVVVSTDGGDKLDAFKVSKTFAWGGLYEHRRALRTSSRRSPTALPRPSRVNLPSRIRQSLPATSRNPDDLESQHADPGCERHDEYK